MPISDLKFPVENIFVFLFTVLYFSIVPASRMLEITPFIDHSAEITHFVTNAK